MVSVVIPSAVHALEDSMILKCVIGQPTCLFTVYWLVKVAAILKHALFCGVLIAGRDEKNSGPIAST